MTDSRVARRFAVVSGKGGVGKSVITANLAAALAAAGQRILVIDADLGLASLDVLLGLHPERTLYDFLRRSCSIDEVVVQTPAGFDLIPAGSGIPDGTVLTPRLEENIKFLLETVGPRYDAILFDAGAGIGDIVLLFAQLADEVLLVVTPEPTALMDAYGLLKILALRYDRTEFTLIANQTNPGCPEDAGARTAYHLQQVASRFLTSAKTAIRIRLIGSIPVDPAIPRAVRARRLLLDLDPQAPSTRVISRVAESLQRMPSIAK